MLRGMIPPETITVALSAGQPLYRAGLEALIGSLPGLRVVAPDSLPPPQVLLWDVEPGNSTSLPPVARGTAILLLVTEQECRAVPAGVTGLFSKEELPAALAVAIRQVARGEQYLSPSLALALLQHYQMDTNRPEAGEQIQQALNALTDREREILALLAQGLSNKAIAARLYLSIRTVEGHLARLYGRLGIHSRTEAMLLAVRYSPHF